MQHALDLADRMQFQHSCTIEVGRLLRLLASQVRRGTIGEIGTGCGVGAAWIASGKAPDVSFVTVESDVARAQAAASLLAVVPSIRILQGDWHLLLEYGPFAMLFADGAKAKEREPEVLLQSLKLGGTIVLDDLTPENRWPPEWRGRVDPVREFWLNDSRVIATEILVTPGSAVILATRVG